MADQAHLDDPHLWRRCEQLGIDLDRFESDRRSAHVADAGGARLPLGHPRRGDHHAHALRGRYGPIRACPGRTFCRVLRQLRRKLCSARYVGGLCTCGMPLLWHVGSARPPAAPAPHPRPPAELLITECRRADAEAAAASTARCRAGAGVTRRGRRPRPPGAVTARLEPTAGDWDVAVFDTATGKRVAGSAFFGASEIAAGLRGRRGSLSVQACRRSGQLGSPPSSSVESEALGPASPRSSRWSRSSTPNEARKDELIGLGLDLTEHGGDGLRGGRAPRRRRREGGCGRPSSSSSTEIGDLAATRARGPRRGPRASRVAVKRPRPAERPRPATGAFDDYNDEMKKLAERQPRHRQAAHAAVQDLTGPPVQGIEITEDVERQRRQAGVPADGRAPRPRVAVRRARHGVGLRAGQRLQGGATRVCGASWATVARSWFRSSTPRASTPRARRPARPNNGPRWPERDRQPGGSLRVPAQELPHQQHRRGRLREHRRRRSRRGRLRAARRAQRRISQFGADPNRNYGGFWGGPGASPSGEAPGGDFAQDYRGTGPSPSPRPATSATWSRAPGDHADHQPHLLQPRAAAARRSRRRARRSTSPSIKALGRRHGGSQRLPQPAELPALRHHRRHRGLDLLRHRRPRVHLRDRPDQLPSRRSPRRSPSTRAARRAAARARAATARPTSRRWRTPPTRSGTP